MIQDAEAAFRRAQTYISWGAPGGDYGSFEPVKASYDEQRHMWQVRCRFKKGEAQKEASLEIDEYSEAVKAYELVS